MFESLGLTADTLALYRVLLQQPELSRDSRLNDLARQLDLPADEVTVQLGELRRLGFLALRWNDTGEEYPLDPAVTFERLAMRRQQEIDDLSEGLKTDRVAAGQFIADYSEFLVRNSARDVEVVEGADRAYQRMQHFRPTRFVWGILPPFSMPAVDRENFSDRALLESGIALRYIFAESQLKTRESREFLEHIVELGGQVRLAPSIPFKLIIFDGESAVMAIDPDGTSVGAVVHHSKAVLTLAMELHRQYWQRGSDPFAPPAADPDSIRSQESEFLRLLVQGATDEQVARKLGVSMRTIRRMAAKLSGQVGASGRFELGVRAAQRG